MANPLLGQVLRSAIGSAMVSRGRAGGPFGGMQSGGLGGGVGAALGGILTGMLGRGMARGRGGNRNALLLMLLPFAMQWVQRNGGIGAVLDRFRQKGFAQHANSWESVGANEPLAPHAVDSVVGRPEIARIAQQLQLPEDEVADGFAEILPEVADQLTPQGSVPAEADEALQGGHDELQKALQELHADMQHL
jgi:uncharacterized protein YidB (DUF937 family)